ncbi:hypothetical protein, partial [Klebsiella pneumoniae]|uniref:hypothetical protein n=1 Tax=Klebsiella pneumoniae TaxID=573 RepID=UPI00355B14D7
WLMMSLWDALRMNMMISYQELVRTFHSKTALWREAGSTARLSLAFVNVCHSRLRITGLLE